MRWLHDRADEDGKVLNSDLVTIIESNPEQVPDDTLRRFVIMGLNGELKAKRGRKRSMVREIRELCAVALYDTLLPEMQKLAQQRKLGGLKKERVDFSPAEVACNMIATELKLGSGENVRNIISRRKLQK